jgi:hypothetical protein
LEVGLFFALVLGCKPVDYGEGPCAEASERVHALACVYDISSLEGWEEVSVPCEVADQERSGRYLVPVSEAAPLPTLFENAQVFDLHYELLTEGFPDIFAGLSWEGYYALVVEPDKDGFFAGNLSAYIAEDSSLDYGFTVWDDPERPETTVSLEQVSLVYQELSEHFTIAPLMFVPSSSNQREAAASWNAPFAIRGENTSISYEAYSKGTAFGSIRFYTLKELAEAEENAEFGYQDILVLEEAPLDIERVVAAFVTGSRQGTLSHLNVRSAARGTPNCYIAEPFSALSEWEGKLVALECGETSWSVREASQEEAMIWWESIRPEPVEIIAPDLSMRDFPGLLEVDTSSAFNRQQNLAAFGAKGSNLATLYQRIPSQYQLDGFVVHFFWYDDFINQSRWQWQGEDLTFAETLDRWLSDPDFTANSTERRARLLALQAAMLDAPVDPALVSALASRIAEIWPFQTTVRFRSSSNAEDALGFSGAGLYESVSVCSEDSLDGDEEGGSWCDLLEEDEETIERGLKTVWASLWGVAAYEERDWYGIDHRQIAMGILVDTRIANEQANIVAFTGNPTANDTRYLVEAQEGELAVVAAEVGVYPESTLLTVEEGKVTAILRVSGSSEVEGEVLTDSELEALGAMLFEIDSVFPVDTPAPEGSSLLWDTEWKIDQNGQLLIKQIRPFLRQD